MNVALPDRLSRQLGFIVESERLKSVLRRTSPIHATERRENSAEHSWTLALMAMVLAEHAEGNPDSCKVLRMLLIHDLVEIDAGDTFCYDLDANVTKAEREARAADVIFGMLPEEQSLEYRSLWEEFEAGISAEAKFANALDRLMPTLQNMHNEGGSWREHGVTSALALERSRPIGVGIPTLWAQVQTYLVEAEQQGWLTATPADSSPFPPS
ncbi:HD domain-containing protein [Roseimicrobium sp. ORNL1]|uniref:HD domain-containing protein n=1 Tax=Roseimicrobium sp. ORNL1 TaxID=2711231 RepID=UPI0013E10DF6|nr:HD domain-containing protein [Roseimicrobium sp. ORNL1]QIF02790.1 HD domain-containing protein [Roseimicrobium sp. ORNL1]